MVPETETLNDTQRYFRHLFGEAPLPGGRIILHNNRQWDKPVYCTSGPEAAALVASWSQDVFVGCGITNSTDAHSRGAASDCIALPGLWVEVDVDPTGQKTSKSGKSRTVPATVIETLRILDMLPSKPTLVVGSSGTKRGIHAYWAFREPWYFETYREGASLEYGWWRTVAELFEMHGYRLDSVYDLARVLRPAGPTNTNHGEPVVIIRESAHRYDPADFAEHSTPPPTKSPVAEMLPDGFVYQNIEVPVEVLTKLESPTKLGMLWRQDPTVKPKDDSQSGWDLELSKEMFRQGVTDPHVHRAVLIEYRETHCSAEEKQAKAYRAAYTKKTYSLARQMAAEVREIASADEDFRRLPNGPWDDPSRILDALEPKIATLKYFYERFYTWEGNCYREISRDDVDTLVWEACDDAAYRENERAVELAKVTEKPPRLVKASCAMAAAAMRAVIAAKKIPDQGQMPMWASGRGPCPVTDIIGLQNGLLNTKTRTLYPPTSNYFAVGASDAIYNPEAKCPRFLAFLEDCFNDDEESKRLVQEWTGYLISGRNDLEKLLMLIGASRGGKGTLVKVWGALIGKSRTVTKKLNSLGEQFGLETLAGASMAVFDDVRVDARRGTMDIMETLLSWVGRGDHEIQRKYRESLRNVPPMARLIITSNEVPNLREESPAFKNRVSLLRFRRSFAGRENVNLASQLIRELPGILNWGLDGLDKLNSNKGGRFTEPKRSQELLRLVDDVTGTVRAFIHDVVEEKPGSRVTRDEIYEAYRAWCGRAGVNPMIRVHFARRLYSAIDDLSESRPTIDGVRTYCYERLKLRMSAAEIELDNTFRPSY